MPRSYGVLKISVWEPQSDFRTLTLTAQWAYTMLISQPQISNLGVVPYTPEKWRRFAAGLTADDLERALHELADGRYIVIDEDTGELLVRTFIKHDAVWKQPKLVTNVRKLIREVESDGIRDYLIERHPWLVEPWNKPEIEAHETVTDTPSDTPIERGIATPIESSRKGVSKGVSPPRARAGPGPGAGSSSSSTNPLRSSEQVHAARAETDQGRETAAAGAWDEAPTDTHVQQVVATLNGNDPRSIQQILPLARQLPAPLFDDVVGRARARIETGTVRNHVGLFVELLRVAGEEARARHAAETAAAIEARTPADEIAYHAGSYARGRHPWPIIQPLLEMKIDRLTDDPGERADLLQHAAAAYQDGLDPEPVVSTTAAPDANVSD